MRAGLPCCEIPGFRFAHPGYHCAVRASRSVSRSLLLRFEKRDGLDAIAVGIADEGGVVAFAVLRPQPRRTVGTAAGRERRGMERIDRFNRAFFFNDTATTEIYTLSLHAAQRSKAAIAD